MSGETQGVKDRLGEMQTEPERDPERTPEKCPEIGRDRDRERQDGWLAPLEFKVMVWPGKGGQEYQNGSVSNGGGGA